MIAKPRLRWTREIARSNGMPSYKFRHRSKVAKQKDITNKPIAIVVQNVAMYIAVLLELCCFTHIDIDRNNIAITNNDTTILKLIDKNAVVKFGIAIPSVSFISVHILYLLFLCSI